MPGLPVLILAGLRDDHRRPDDASEVAGQLAAAQADVTLHGLDCGHEWAPREEDLCLARARLSRLTPS